MSPSVTPSSNSDTLAGDGIWSDETEWEIADSEGNLIWNIERDTKVDEDDLAWPVIVHLRGALESDAIAILTEVAATQEP